MIADFLEVSGLSPSGLNVIPQGAATRVADLTPDEKRKMIEDVVGISKFDDKKAEAQKQLSQADTKLQIELARTGEMKSQLERLEEQRNDLVRFNQLEGAAELAQGRPDLEEDNGAPREAQLEQAHGGGAHPQA